VQIDYYPTSSRKKELIEKGWGGIRERERERESEREEEDINSVIAVAYLK